MRMDGATRTGTCAGAGGAAGAMATGAGGGVFVTAVMVWVTGGGTAI